MMNPHFSEKKESHQKKIDNFKSYRKGFCINPLSLLQPEGDVALSEAAEAKATKMAAVKKAYRRLSKLYHPDKGGGDPESVCVCVFPSNT